MDDERLLELFLRRDQAALEQTQKQYGAYCLAVADNILGSRQDAEECVNDALLRAWNAIPPKRPARLGPYLAKITRNLAINRLRDRSAEKRGGGELDAVLDELGECVTGSGESAEDALLARELAESVRRFVRTLPQREQGLFLRRYFFAESVSEIARRYGMTENHVSVTLARTRRALRKTLIKEGYLHE